MVGKAKMTLSGIRIDRLVPVRDDTKIGHDFTVKATLKVSKRSIGALSGEGIDSLELEWKETIDWFEYRAVDGTWHLKGTDRKDMYVENPNSNTFNAWQKQRYFLATDISNRPPAALTAAHTAAIKAKTDEDKAAKHWIAENGFEWTIPVTDKPALGLKPVAGSSGGGGASLVTSNSRRRVIYFDLGFKGSSARVSATQILETVNGRPTIHKFIVPGIKKAEADDSTKLAAWRAELARS